MAREEVAPKSYSVRKLGSSGVISILEALYDWQASARDWSAGVMRELERGLGLGGGSGIQIYDTTHKDRFDLLSIDQHNTPEGWLELGREMTVDPERASEYLRVHRRATIWTVAPILPRLPFGEAMRATMARAGFADMLAINGHSPSGIGCCLYIFSDRIIRFTPQRALELRRIASHVATAHRLRHKVVTAASEPARGVEAILDVQGRLQHATTPLAASRDGRESLKSELQAREWARGRARREEPERALRVWKGLVGARWTLVDQFETNGKRYVLARELPSSSRAIARSPSASTKSQRSQRLAARTKSSLTSSASHTRPFAC